jgi:hypothetical protein
VRAVPLPNILRTWLVARGHDDAHRSWVNGHLVFADRGWTATRNTVVGVAIDPLTGSVGRIKSPIVGNAYSVFGRDVPWTVRLLEKGLGSIPSFRSVHVDPGPVVRLGGEVPRPVDDRPPFCPDVCVATPDALAAYPGNPVSETLSGNSGRYAPFVRVGLYREAARAAEAADPRRDVVVVDARTGEVRVMRPPDDGTGVRCCGVDPSGQVGWLATRATLYFFDV